MPAGGEPERSRGQFAQLAERIELSLNLAQRGRSVLKSCSPAGVGITLRVVRVSRRSFRRSSSRRTDWLKADCDFPSLVAARVKLRASATAAKIARSLSSSFSIHKPD